ncbi:hypothetical protein Pint_31950 [Pistacia integerrima]|uniref:Uncharacterized protein n=1 Tax=Pistacia integerrima TaxID=434235 RepID=A0ACC0XQ47_9ROSI|nr:hypothetical protein Pint_31950 [Pistacia integerrima]
MREHRRRTRSPPRPRNRDRETEENRIQRINRSRPVSSGSRQCYVNEDDNDRNGYERKLSQFNETLPRSELIFRKFEWANLLACKPEKWDFGRILNENDNVLGFNKSKIPYYNDGAVFPSRKYHLSVNENVERGLYREEKKLGFVSKDSLLPYTTTAFQLKGDYNEMYKDGGFCRSREMLDGSIAHGGYCCETPVSKPSSMRSFAFVEEQGNMASAQDDYRVQSSVRASFVDSMVQTCVRASIVDSIVNKLDGNNNSIRNGIRYGREIEHNQALHHEYLNGGKESVTKEEDRECSGSRTSHYSRGSQDVDYSGSASGSRGFDNECGLEVNLDNGGLQVGEDYGFLKDGGLESYEEGLKRLDEDFLHENINRSQQMLGEEELGYEDQSKKVLRRGRVIDLRKITRSPNHTSSFDCITSHENEQWTTEDTERFLVLKDLESRQPLDEMTSHNLLPSPFLPVSMQEHSTGHFQHSSVDLKKPLGPARNVMERLGPAPNIKKRLKRSSRPVKSHKQNEFTGRYLDDFREGVHIQGDDYLEVQMESSDAEPLEHTECFEQLVHSAFLKFAKALNDSTAQQRKYTERGGKCTLKCSVCCRKSKDFVDALSLAQHAFMSKTAGLRAEHLGFHRALCVLMGWNNAATPNGLWVPRVLPYAEALALKQDLIIWPPVVFVHNSSIANTNPDERIIATIEELESIIRGNLSFKHLIILTLL